MDKKEFIPLGCTKIYKNPNTIALCLKCAQAKLVNYGIFNNSAKCPHCSQKFSMRNSYNDLMALTGNPEKQIFAIQLRELFDAIDMNNAQSFNEHINQIVNALKAKLIYKDDVVEAFCTQRSNLQTLIDAVVGLINQSAENKPIWITDIFKYLIDITLVKDIIDGICFGDYNSQIINNLFTLGFNLGVKDQFGNTLLHKVIAKGEGVKDVALLLIDHGIFVNEKDYFGYTPLNRAIDQDMKEVALSLIDHGAFVNEKDYWGHAPLNKAIDKNMQEVALSLIDHGAFVNEKDKWGDAPLCKAIYKNSTEVALSLIDHGAFVNEKDKWGDAPLHIATYKNMQEVVDSLKLHGALK